jgi:hypothetical protein
MAAESSYIKTNISGSIVLSDGTGTPVTLTLAYDRGDLAIGPLSDKLNELVTVQRRGKFVSHAHGARVFPSVSFSAYCGNLVGGTTSAPGTPTEFLTRQGAYAANLGTLGTGRPLTIDMIITIEGTNFGDSDDEVVTLNDVHCTIQWAEAADGNTITVTGTILGAVGLDNGTNSAVSIAQIS